MTDFMTALQATLVQLTCARDPRARTRSGPASSSSFKVVNSSESTSKKTSSPCQWVVCAYQKGVQLQSTCNLCRESHKTQVWLCFLIVSFLSISTCAASSPETNQLQSCLKLLKNRIEKSDAELYTPPFSKNCEDASLKCYILELKMVLDEEGIKGPAVDCIFEADNKMNTMFDGCPACETYPLTNITMFLEGLNTLLEAITAGGGK